MNTENSKTNEPHRLKLDLTDKRNLKNKIKIWLQPIYVFITLGKTSNQNTKTKKFKISAPTWNDTFDLPDGSYSISDIKNYFEFIIKNMKL